MGVNIITKYCLCVVAVPPGNPIIEAKDEVLSEGNETEMTCTAMSSKPAATIRWMKGDKELAGGQTEPNEKKNTQQLCADGSSCVF